MEDNKIFCEPMCLRQDQKCSLPAGGKIGRNHVRFAARRKALMLCYYYPPVATSGVVRSVGFARMLNRFGWEPLILTVKEARDVNVHRGADVPAGIEVVRTREFESRGDDRIHAGCGKPVPAPVRFRAA